MLVGAAACAAKVDDQAKQNDVTVEQLTAERGRHLRGPVRVVIEAARAHGNLSAEQTQALATISAELEADHESRKKLRDELRRSAVAVVRQGTADSQTFDRSVGEAVRAFEQRMHRSADALEEIHGILTPAQRAAVATALRARIVEKLGPGRHDEKRRREGIQRLASHLMLTTLQIDELRAMKKELLGEKQRLRPSREELLELMDAFEGDDFRTALNGFRAKKAKVLRAHVARAGKRTESVLSLLTAEQRELLADLIQHGPRKLLLGDSRDQKTSPTSK